MAHAQTSATRAPETPPGAVGQAGSFTLEPRAPFPNIVVDRTGDKPREFYQPDDFRAAFPQMDERSIQWLLNREVAGTGIPGLNLATASIYTAADCVHAAAPDLLAERKAISEHLGSLEWGTPEHAQQLLSEVIDKFYKSAAVAKAEGGAA